MQGIEKRAPSTLMSLNFVLSLFLSLSLRKGGLFSVSNSASLPQSLICFKNKQTKKTTTILHQSMAGSLPKEQERAVRVEKGALGQ